jgi:tol-pal system protein YbgF
MRFFRHLAVLTLCAAGLAAPAAHAQMSASDMVMRLEAIEHQMRQLTGQIEQLQFRNQQLEQQLRAMQGGAAPQPSGRPGPQGLPQPQFQQQAPAAAPGRRSELEPVDNPPGASPNLSPQRQGAMSQRGDVYDPRLDPNAPGAPRPLGALPPGQPSAPPADIAADEPVGARGGREPGAPLDITTLSANAAAGRDLSPAARAPAPAGAMASVSPPAQTPRDQYDLGYGFIQRKDYAAAEETFRDFLARYPNDRLTPDAQYWLGESLFQRQRYRDAAEAFLAVSTKHETSAKAPESLLRLGQSLAALRERSAACATFAEIGRKYPRASLSVKQGVERELKRAGC